MGMTADSMTTSASTRQRLTPLQVDFILGPVSISVASADVNLAPSLARAYGCRYTDDRCEVTLFLPVPRSESLLCDLRAGAAVAAVFSRPSTHQTLQLKGAQANTMPLARGDRESMIAYGKAFVAEIGALGYADLFTGKLVSAVTEDAVAISFRPVAAFEQTPGPAAGKSLDTLE